MTTARLEEGKWKKQPKKYYTEMKKNLRNLELIIYTLWFLINNETQKYFDIFLENVLCKKNKNKQQKKKKKKRNFRLYYYSYSCYIVYKNLWTE